MAFTIAEEKKTLRQRIRKELAALTPEEQLPSDEALFERFLALPQVREAKTIFAFWGVPGKEPDTGKLIKKLVAQGKRVCLPRMLPGHLMETPRYVPERPLVYITFGISEPDQDCPLIPKEEIDLVLVPAVCYDRRGYRLGFGGGYYDRWLEDYKGFKVGLCRKAVLQDTVPIEEHDSFVDVLITEEECLSPKG